eukprot:6209733-Pleurochrysis_carterae.AAC.2
MGRDRVDERERWAPRAGEEGVVSGPPHPSPIRRRGRVPVAPTPSASPTLVREGRPAVEPWLTSPRAGVGTVQGAERGALRKYACYASTKWGTMYASAKLWRVAT